MPSSLRRVARTRRPLIALIVLLVVIGVAYLVHSDTSTAPHDSSAARQSSSGQVALSWLPVEAQHTVALIRAGGPFPYSRDGVVFHNEEGRLPHERDGYYHEYTVPTPGVSTRGARRIITGSDGEFYYTADHYETFRRVDVHR